MRSARITDVDLLAQYDRPAFAYSGAQRKMFPALDGADFLRRLAAHRRRRLQPRRRAGGRPTTTSSTGRSASTAPPRRHWPRTRASSSTADVPEGRPRGDVRRHEVGLLLCRLRLPAGRAGSTPSSLNGQQGRRRGERPGPERRHRRHPVREAAAVGVLRQGRRQHPACRHHRQWQGDGAARRPGVGDHLEPAHRRRRDDVHPRRRRPRCPSSRARCGSCCSTGSAGRTSSRSPSPRPSPQRCRRRHRPAAPTPTSTSAAS